MDTKKSQKINTTIAKSQASDSTTQQKPKAGMFSYQNSDDEDSDEESEEEPTVEDKEETPEETSDETFGEMTQAITTPLKPKNGMFSYQNADDEDSDEESEEEPKEEEEETPEETSDETFGEMTHANFALQQEQNTVVEVVTIFGARSGRKINTYIIGLENSQEEQRAFLRIMKRKFGCNGSMKVVAYEGVDVPALHLQGDQIKKVKAFLAEQNILNVVVKDLIV
jgi:translation initiation factor 1 (eIF-1/SUI1)